MKRGHRVAIVAAIACGLVLAGCGALSLTGFVHTEDRFENCPIDGCPDDPPLLGMNLVTGLAGIVLAALILAAAAVVTVLRRARTSRETERWRAADWTLVGGAVALLAVSPLRWSSRVDFGGSVDDIVQGADAWSSWPFGATVAIGAGAAVLWLAARRTRWSGGAALALLGVAAGLAGGHAVSIGAGRWSGAGFEIVDGPGYWLALGLLTVQAVTMTVAGSRRRS